MSFLQQRNYQTSLRSCGCRDCWAVGLFTPCHSPPDLTFRASLSQTPIDSLSSFQIETLPPELFKCKKLRTLNLGNNCLQTLPSRFGELTGLTQLELRGNRLECLPVELGECRLLKRSGLVVEEDVFNTLPSEIKEQLWRADKEQAWAAVEWSSDGCFFFLLSRGKTKLEIFAPVGDQGSWMALASHSTGIVQSHGRSRSPKDVFLEISKRMFAKTKKLSAGLVMTCTAAWWWWWWLLSGIVLKVKSASRQSKQLMSTMHVTVRHCYKWENLNYFFFRLHQLMCAHDYLFADLVIRYANWAPSHLASASVWCCSAARLRIPADVGKWFVTATSKLICQGGKVWTRPLWALCTKGVKAFGASKQTVWWWQTDLSRLTAWSQRGP